MQSGQQIEKVKVAITGTLAHPRSVFATFINGTENGLFVESVTFETHYLVSAKQDSQKSKKAARMGTAVITEDELMGYIAAHRFPSTLLPERPQYWGQNLPHITWTKKLVPELCLISYKNEAGFRTMRRVMWISSGESPTSYEGGVKWIGAYDGPTFKSWRADRIEELEVLGSATDLLNA